MRGYEDVCHLREFALERFSKVDRLMNNARPQLLGGCHSETLKAGKNSRTSIYGESRIGAIPYEMNKVPALQRNC